MTGLWRTKKARSWN